MKIKYTQGSAHGDIDFALAIALENDSDDDFQPAFLNQALALRSCAVTKQVKEKNTKRRSLKLERRQRGSGEAGDPVRLDDEEGKDVKICCDVESTVAKKRERKGNENRVLKDHNSKILDNVGTGAIVVVEGDENGNPVRSGKLAKASSFSTPGLDDSDRIESTDRRSLACDQSELRVSRFDFKRKTESSVHSDGAKKVKTAAEDGLQSDGAKKVKTSAESVRTDASGELDSLSFDGDERVRFDLDAEVDEETIICTQIEAPVGLELEQGRSEAAVDVVKMTVEERPKRKYNIYDIVLGNHRTDQVPNSAVEKKSESEGDAVDKQQVECEGNVEEIYSSGTALRALVDEAELDYEALISNEEGNESIDSLECPVCGIDLSVHHTQVVDLSVRDREQHVGDCLMKSNMFCGRTNPEDCLRGDFESVQQLSSEQTGRGKALDCPVCGVCIEELSAAQREEHTNACLEKVKLPCVGRISGDFQPGCTGMEGISQVLTSPRTVMTENIVCPVCGDCIEELSTAQREAHTNACLDDNKGEGPGEVAKPAAAEVAQALGRPDVGPVVKWLTDLNLGKYVDIFVKEEIDWDTLKWLTEEDLSSLGITALGPRRKIVCAIQELRKPALTAQHKAAMQEAQRLSDSVVVSSVDTLQGSKKSIADFFVSRHTGPRVPAPDSNTLAGPKAAGITSTAGVFVRNRGQRGPVTAGGNLRNSSTSGIPSWMCIPGTSFRVDAFKYTTGNCSHWFLTHFHSDHYQGLTRGFRHGKIFCSSITARLVNLRIGVPFDRIQVLPLNETVFIDGVRVTFIDANHCPGSVMILFEPPNGKAVLHTGDFRFCSDMTCNEVLKACPIKTLILDTTYCDPQYDFPKQDTIVQFVIDAIEAEAFNTKTLFLIGTYTIGKERIFLEVGKALKKYVYVGKAKQRLLDCMDLSEEDKKWLTTKDQESHIHVVPLWSVASFKRMGSISRHYHGRYNSIVAFSPTGWSFGKDKKRMQGRPGRRYQQGSIIRYEVPYSEHSSFTELKEFVRATAPENIIPSVISSSGLTADAMVASLLCEES